MTPGAAAHRRQRFTWRTAAIMAIGALLAIGYLRLVTEAWAIGRSIEADPNVYRYAGLPPEPPEPECPAPVTSPNRWWRPAGGEPSTIEFGGIIRNSSDQTIRGLRVHGYAYDNRGGLLARTTVPCEPSTLAPDERATYESVLVAPSEPLWFKVAPECDPF